MLKAREYFCVVMISILLIAVVDFFTNSISPIWDSASYMDMAQNGVLGNDHLVAPFAYSFGMPLLAGVLSKVFSISLNNGFLWVTYFAAFTFLFASFLLARKFTDSSVKAMIPMLFSGGSVMHLKFPLYVSTSIDVAGFAIIMIAVWAFYSGYFWTSFFISAFGIFFKEFLAIPLFLILWELAKRYRQGPNKRLRMALSFAILLALAVILVPRLGLPIVDSIQEIDPVHRPRSLTRLILNPLNILRDINILFDTMTYWLPCILLLTRARFRALITHLQPKAEYLLGFLFLNYLLVMYGGSNVDLFVAYSAPIQIIVLTVLLGMGIHPFEWVVAFGCVFVYNRIFSNIPLPGNGFDAFIDFYAGWGSRVNVATLTRFLELFFDVAILWTLRSILGRWNQLLGRSKQKTE